MTLARSPRALPILVVAAALLASTCLAVAATTAQRQSLPSPLAVAGCLALIFVGVRFHLLVRVGGQKVQLCWSEAGFLFALTVVPPAWVVLLTPPTVVASLAVRRFAPVKIVYNAATCTVAASSMAAIVSLTDASRPFVGTELLGLAASGAAAGLVTYLAVATVIAVVQDVPFLTTWRAAAGLQLLTLGGQLGVAIGVLFLFDQYGLTAAVAAPVMAWSLQQGYEGRLRGAQERQAGQQHAAAVGHLTEDLDEPGVLRRATEDACALVDVEVLDVEVPAHGDSPALLYRYSRRGDPWIGGPADAPALPARVVAELPVPTRDGAPAGTLRAWLVGAAPDLRLGRFEQDALASLAAYTGAAIRNARLHAEQTYHATHDRLTGLPVRQVLVDRIHASAVAQSQHGLSPVALILIDLTGYQDLVRSLGHDTAEHLLARTAAQLRGALAPGEFLAHIGGDDFCVYLDTRDGIHGLEDVTAPAHVETRALALLAAAAEPYRIDDVGTVELAAVAGTAYSSTAVLSGAELLRQAVVALDQARLYHVAVASYEPATDLLGGPAAKVMTSELHAAFERGEFHLEYQPILDLHSAVPVAVEVLLRWLHPIRGMLYPGEFMAVLENSPDHGRFLNWQLEQALQARASWDTDRDLPISINIAFRCLLNRSFPGQVAAALERAGVPGTQLMLEVADTQSLTGAVPLTEVLTQLRHLGVRIAIDKFGTGATTFGGLARLPATHVKIAAEFVQNALDPDLLLEIGLAVELARHNDLKVVAIGVPSDEHAAALLRLGCRLGQGTHLVPAMSPARIGSYLLTAPMPEIVNDPDVIDLNSRRPRATPTPATT